MRIVPNKDYMQKTIPYWNGLDWSEGKVFVEDGYTWTVIDVTWNWLVWTIICEKQTLYSSN